MRWMTPSESTTACGCSPFWGVLTIWTMLLSSPAHPLEIEADVIKKDRREILLSIELTFPYLATRCRAILVARPSGMLPQTSGQRIGGGRTGNHPHESMPYHTNDDVRRRD